MAHKIVVDIDKLECVAWTGIPKGFTDTFADGVTWVLEYIDSLAEQRDVNMTIFKKEKQNGN